MDYCGQVSRQLKGKTITQAQVDGDVVILKLNDDTKFIYNASDGGYSTFGIEGIDTFKEELDELTAERREDRMTVKELKKILDYYDDQDLVEIEVHATEYGRAILTINNNIELSIEN